MKPRSWLLLALPVLLIGVFVWFEVRVLADHEPGVALAKPEEAVKQAIDLNTELAKLFIGIATSLIGAVAYYLRSRMKGFSAIPTVSIITTILTLVAAVFSIFFGHLFLVIMRNQLANQYFNPFATALSWAERSQFLLLVGALSWFSILVLERETARIEAPPDEKD